MREESAKRPEDNKDTRVSWRGTIRAGEVSAAALKAARSAPQAPKKSPRPQHCSAEEYARFVTSATVSEAYRRQMLGFRRRFVARWPKLPDWYEEPLAIRVGRLPGQERRRPAELTCKRSYQARSYLLYLALRGLAPLDYPWLLGASWLRPFDVAERLGTDVGVDLLVGEAADLGYNRPSARQAMRWSAGRIILHTSVRHVDELRAEHVDELLCAVRRFAGRKDLAAFYGTPEEYGESPSKGWITHLSQLGTVLYHRGQVSEPPRKAMPAYARGYPAPLAMRVVVDRWLDVRRLTNRPATVSKLDTALSQFMAWLVREEPGARRFADVTREHIEGYLKALAEKPTERTGWPMSVFTRAGHVSSLRSFFRETSAWGWDGAASRPLLGPSDMPRRPERIPRYIPEVELERLMTAMRKLECPYQRAALLVARWSGARKGEIRRLATDCLDAYPDGTPRLRLPAGKTYRERMIPIHEEAADAIRVVQALRHARSGERAFPDELTGENVRYLFMDRGKLLSVYYLFQTPIREACRAVGLVDAAGRPTVSAHRFRHTVGTQLAERGAKLHTIMKVLGHQSVSMSLVYAQISDQAVLKDYQAVLGPGATVAGPAAKELRQGALSAEAVGWLKANFFKTELELGRCLRLPSEGPCECELYLTCAKFVTTPAYAPRLRRRRQTELRLAEDARERGWPREIERHLATAMRVEGLLRDLGEPLEGLVADDLSPCDPIS